MRSVTRGLLGVFVLLTASIGSAADLFSTHFTDETLRIDYFHSGDAQSETATLDRLLRQGQWAGSRSHLIDESRLGSYAVEVREKSTDLLIFSRGFDSYFAEYQTTGAATSGTARTYHESVLVPFPQHPVSIALVKRPRTGSTREISRFDVDPHSPLIALEPPRQGATIVEELVNGDVHSKVDIAFIGEGYTEADTKLFKQDLKRLSSALLAQEPFSAQRRSFNIRGVLAPSNHAGCDEPTRGIYRDTALAASFNSLGSSRYLLTEDNRALRDIAANVPYDALIIMVNHQRYGGGGIYNFYCVFTAHNHWSSYLLVHEFGHSFTGLADEYYTSSVAYNDFYPRGVEPAEPNITALLEPGNLKWKDLVSDGTSLPTPWEKASFDELENSYQTTRSELTSAIANASRDGQSTDKVSDLIAEEDAISRDHAEEVAVFLARDGSATRIGAFEGAGYSSEGLYRPMVDCVMFTKGLRPFCRVCERAVLATIQKLTE